MKKLLFFLFIIGLGFCLSCESELEDENACNPEVLAFTASVTINEEPECYQNGGLGFNNSSNVLSLILFTPRNSTGAEIDVQFSVPPQGFQFNESYSVASGEYNNSLPVTSGNIILLEDNYPTDPTLLQYKGTIDLTFQGQGSEVVSISGTVSFERP